jgi:prephenate dehydratase
VGKGIFLLHGGVSHHFLRLLDLVCMQGQGEGKQLCYACFSQAVSQVDSITSSTGLAPLESGLSGEVLVIEAFLPNSYYTLIAEVVEVFEYQQSSHLADGVARQAHLPIERFEGCF